MEQTLRDKGQLDEAIFEFREAIRLKKDFAGAHNNLGIALGEKGQLDEAFAEFHEAIRLKKDSVEAHTCLGNALLLKGQLDEAIAECREAIRINKDFAMAHYNLGHALRKKGQLDEAISELRAAIRLADVRLNKDKANFHNELSIAPNEKWQLDEAIAEAREAIRLKKDYGMGRVNLGVALAKLGRLDDAIVEFHEAIRLNKDDASAHYNLGTALRVKGQLDEALVSLRCGHELGSKDPRWQIPSAELVKECERLVIFNGKLPAILSRQKQPADPAERFTFAQLCAMPSKKCYVASVRFFREAFEQEPKLADDLDAGNRYAAACAATRAGCGQGKDADKLDAKERARLREQALDWLRADLKAHRQVMEKSAGKASPAMTQWMQHLLVDTDFAGLRGENALAMLPEAEREAWQKLWQEVEALRRSAATTTKSPNQLKGKEGSPGKD